MEGTKAGPNYMRGKALKKYFESELERIKHLLYLNWVNFTLMKKYHLIIQTDLNFDQTLFPFSDFHTYISNCLLD